MRTEEEIEKQVAGLLAMKEWLPERSAFGTHNWLEIDAQVDIITGKKDPNYYYIDEYSDEFVDGDNDIFERASEAKDWLIKNSDKDLFETRN